MITNNAPVYIRAIRSNHLCYLWPLKNIHGICDHPASFADLFFQLPRIPAAVTDKNFDVLPREVVIVDMSNGLLKISAEVNIVENR